ncbi:MAG: TRAP transporter small permease [Deltaproteobacteria bacterium]|jgi:TRAP-type C4-dicarboxylate transport system permease small subunit|nr:TRAP transporter small permease [Deltaproteobacteria bacterium]
MTHNTTPESPQEPQDTKGEFAFQLFCALIFLGMIGLVFYNAFLRYVFRSSFPPSEEWARFLFMFITFFGAIEAFYRKKHIAVDLFVGLFGGITRKTLDVVAQSLGLCALALLLWGGVVLVEQTMDTYSVATGINMGFIYGALPILAAAALVIRGKELLDMLRKPASEFHKANYDPLVDFDPSKIEG